MTTTASPDDVIDFWRQAGPDRWFEKDEDFDRQIAESFSGLHSDAASGALDQWSDEPNGSLAVLLVLDQFSRNLFRNSPKAFAQDEKARIIADKAVRRGFDSRFDAQIRCFFYMPFEHSESLADQDRCLLLVHPLHGQNYLQYAIKHRDIIRRFGRFPHRNAVLGRHTSPAERAFLEAGGFAG